MLATTTPTLEKINPKIRKFVTTNRRMLIDGKWVDAKSGDTFHVYNPATGEVAHVAAGEKADIDFAVKAARRAFEQGPWSRMTHSQRGKLIWKLADLSKKTWKNSPRSSPLITENRLRSPASRISARNRSVPLHAGWSTKIDGQTLSPSKLGHDFFAYTLREPVGVVGQIIPWNFPLLMAAWKLGPAWPPGAPSCLSPPNKRPFRPSSRRTDRGSRLSAGRSQYRYRVMVKPPGPHWRRIRTSTRLPLPVRPRSEN